MATDDRFAVFAIYPNGDVKLFRKIKPSFNRNQLEREAKQLSQNNKQGIRYEVNAHIE